MKLPFSSESLAKQITVKSAVNPSLWACAVISLFLFYLSSKTGGLISIAFFIVGLLPVLCFCISYLYLLFKNPNYLRSEEHQWRMEALRLFGDKDNPLGASAEHVVSMNNPALPSPSGHE